MKNTYDTPEDFANAVAREGKEGWINGTYLVAGRQVGIKAFGTWVQRIHADTLWDNGEFNTQRDMKKFIVDHIGH